MLGWLTLLIVTVGRTLTPMLSLAPASGRRRLPREELALTVGLWLLVAGLALGERPLMLAGALLVLGAIAIFAALTARIGRQHRMDGLEGPLAHVVTGMFFLAQAAILGIGMLLGLDASSARLTAYVVALLVGWAGGVTLGHLGKLLFGLGLVAARPAAEQAALYPRRVWLVEAIVFAVGTELLVNGVLGGSETVALLAGLLRAGAAATALVGAALTVHPGRRALRALRPPLTAAAA